MSLPPLLRVLANLRGRAASNLTTARIHPSQAAREASQARADAYLLAAMDLEQALAEAMDPVLQQMAKRRWKKHLAARAALAARVVKIDPSPPFERAGGDVVCEACSMAYYDHPEHPRFPFLTVLCDGSVVKL